MQSVDKKYFAFNKGLNTEASLMAWPEGYTIDEQNYDLLPDGSRRRRYGLQVEAGESAGGVTYEGSTEDATCAIRTFRWTDVAKIANQNKLVVQIGSSVYFWDEPKSGSLGVHDYEIDLLNHKVTWTDPTSGFSYEANDDTLAKAICDFAQVNGKLVIVNAHTEPLLVTFDEDNALTIEELTIRERDVEGIDDGVGFMVQPTTLSDYHEYNLWNRGWSPANISAYFTDQTKYPSKNMIHYMGMRRQVDALYSDDDGIKVFSPDKLVAELFQNMSAPQGHIIRETFNRRIGYAAVVGSSSSYTYPIANIQVVASATPGYRKFQVTSQAAAHGVVVNDVVAFTGVVVGWNFSGVNYINRPYNKTYTVTASVDANTFEVEVPVSDTWVANVLKTGSYTNTTSFGNIYNLDPEAYPARRRFTVVNSFSGRVFYAGCPDDRLANRIYFSAVIENDEDFEQCYQEADPTSEFISDLVATDGGYIVIPEVGTVLRLLPYGRSLLVFGSNGIWQIAPGPNGYFSANGYSVQKISATGVVSKRSVIDAEDVPMYWGQDGVYAIVQDTNTGFLVSRNISKDTINNLFNSLRFLEKARSKGTYDPTLKRAFWLYNSRLTNEPSGDPPLTGTDMVQTTAVTPIGEIDDTDLPGVYFDSVLILDLRNQAWIKWKFGDDPNMVIRDLISMPLSYVTDNDNRIKIFAQNLDDDYLKTYVIGEFTDSASFEDFGYVTSAYIISGPDVVGEPSRKRTAPYVHVFQRYVDGSETYMQPRWDWSRGTDSGKIGNYRLVYREFRTSDESYGVVVTRNKIMGRGRSLILAFKAGDRTPSWIDGWEIKYDFSERI